MEIYLIRHTTPDVEKGVCYGQSDLRVTESFAEEVTLIQPHLPERFDAVYSSPLIRCRQLAETLFPDAAIKFDDRLKEIHCGDWELLPWDAIDREVMDGWMENRIHACIPGGESYQQLYNRVVDFFEGIRHAGRVAVVSHGGVLRSLLAYITGTPLHQSFDAFKIHYGCVARLRKDDDAFVHSILHNRQTAVEQHRPSTAA